MVVNSVGRAVLHRDRARSRLVARNGRFNYVGCQKSGNSIVSRSHPSASRSKAGFGPQAD